MSLRRAILIIALLAAVEAIAWWWMHPPLAGLNDPVLSWTPGEDGGRRAVGGGRLAEDGERRAVGGGQLAEDGGQRAEDGGQKAEDRGRLAEGSWQRAEDGGQRTEKTGSTTLSADYPPRTASQPPTANRQLPTANRPSPTPRPEIYAQSAPGLRCSDGKVYSLDRGDGVTVFMAFFEWNLADTGSILEAFQHMPEYCMGALGLKLVEKAPPITYEIGSSAGEMAGDRGQRLEVSLQDQTNSIQNSKFKIQNPPPVSLIFDHTIFRVGGTGRGAGDLVHSFKAVWISGLNDIYGRQGLFGNDRNDERGILVKSAIKRFRPAYTRVVQGAVRGAHDTESAWKIFEESMLNDLKMEARR